jgi:hypothetical protein
MSAGVKGSLLVPSGMCVVQLGRFRCSGGLYGDVVSHSDSLPFS